MKRLLIRDDDEDLFDVPLQPILYHYYKENSKEIRRMVKQQVRVDHLVYKSHLQENVVLPGEGLLKLCNHVPFFKSYCCMFWLFKEFQNSEHVNIKALISLNTSLAVKGKVIRYRPGVAQGVGRGIAVLFHDRGTRRGWVVSITPWPHFTPEKDPVPILQEAGWVPGPVWMGRKSRPHRDLILDRPACGQSLYRLSSSVAIRLTITSGICLIVTGNAVKKGSPQWRVLLCSFFSLGVAELFF